MPKFTYVAIDSKGQKIRKTIEAHSKAEIIKTLDQAGLTPIRIEKASGIDFSSLKEVNIGGIPMREKVLLFKQLSLMFNAALPVSKVFQILLKQEDIYPPIRKIMQEVHTEVMSGTKLHKAFAKHTDLFEDFSLAIIRAGEASGQLDKAFAQLARYYTNRYKINNSVKSALAYPIAVIVIVILILAFILWFVLPQMEGVFTEFKVKLPITTRILLFLSHSMRTYYYLYILVVILAGGALYSLIKAPTTKRFLDFLYPKLPMFGKIYTKTQIAHITNTMAMLLNGGVSIVNTLQATKKATSNFWYQLEIENMLEYVKVGKKMSEYLENSKVFPPLMTYMIQIGEETGELAFILQKLAKFYQREVSQTLKGLSSVIQPILILFLGIVVAIIVTAIYLPLSQLAQNVT